jgi:hypothetical protein
LFRMTTRGLNIDYVHTPENLSLSKIYNTVSSEIEINEYITLLDQDTELSTEYFLELARLQNQGETLILPKVACGEIIVSPGKRFISHGMLVQNIETGPINSKNLLAINSGMSISGAVFRKFQYHTQLRFYGTDTYFMRFYEMHFRKAYVMNSMIQHSLAERENKDKKWRKSHIKEKLRTFEIIFSNSLVEILFSRIHIFLIKIKTFFQMQ